MEPSNFTARCVACEESFDTLVVGVADDQFDTTRYLMFQVDLRPDAQDVSLGIDGIYVERDDQRWSCYGGIERCSLTRTELSLQFNAKGTRALGCRQLLIRLDLSREAFESLRSGFARLSQMGLSLEADAQQSAEGARRGGE